MAKFNNIPNYARTHIYTQTHTHTGNDSLVLSCHGMGMKWKLKWTMYYILHACVCASVQNKMKVPLIYYWNDRNSKERKKEKETEKNSHGKHRKLLLQTFYQNIKLVHFVLVMLANWYVQNVDKHTHTQCYASMYTEIAIPHGRAERCIAVGERPNFH